MLRIGSVLVAAIAVALMIAPQSALAGGKGGGGGGGNHASHASSSRGTTQGGKHIPETGMAARQTTKHKPSISPIVIRKHIDKSSP